MNTYEENEITLVWFKREIEIADEVYDGLSVYVNNAAESRRLETVNVLCEGRWSWFVLIHGAESEVALEDAERELRDTAERHWINPDLVYEFTDQKKLMEFLTDVMSQSWCFDSREARRSAA